MFNIGNVTELKLQPTKKHLGDVKKWLEKEWSETHQGFYCNWKIIEESFEKGNLNIITDNDFACGFVVYKIYGLTAKIDILEIDPSNRKNGLAKKLVGETLEFLKSKRVLAVELFCSPENSEPFWKKIGFENFPQLPRQSKINLYKTLIETLPSSEEVKAKNEIKLWDCEPYLAEKRAPKWIWDLGCLGEGIGTLTKPIIFPAAQDWQIELSISGEVIITDKVKYCGLDEVELGSFMIIRNVSEKKH